MRILIALAVACSIVYARPKMSKRTFNNPKRPHPKDLPPTVTSEAHKQIIASSFPKNFDWCEKGFCHPSWNQHIPQYCGS